MNMEKNNEIENAWKQYYKLFDWLIKVKDYLF